MIIEEYYERLDGADPLSGLDLVAPDVEFLIAIPGHDVRGSGRPDLEAYVAGRPAVGRRHHVHRRAVDGDLEMVHGVVTEADGRGTGSFTATALVADGLVTRYQAFFRPDFGMFPLPVGGE
ncbi:nuclear transport factor 2 family protein [Actinomycetospora straminea]|uniref:SnoaL-like domain-containing protein n=1 Tax=Actinomycetospora straminea TaxID=663607 RepID=A0ABP9EMR9_9PSEU|nr:nuclear transport factor 2 family protein [Actinomycetospora straminea]MDD7933814.1 nuclear transport factor 2 family protein [Actinomycetospora straminea]